MQVAGRRRPSREFLLCRRHGAPTGQVQLKPPADGRHRSREVFNALSGVL